MKVVSLNPRAARSEEVVDRARLLLDMAEKGEIVDLSYAAAKPDGSITNGFTATDDAPRRLASVARLLHRLHGIMDAQAE
jgi:hypothetical protein